MEDHTKKMRTDALTFILGLFMVAFAVIGIALKDSNTELIDQNLDLFEQRDENRSIIDSLQSELDSLHTLSWENIEYWIDTLGIEHKEIVMQQVALETGMLTSAICQENNNLFGMKEPRVRETTALGTKRGHAFYHNYIDSIKDYKLWQDNMYGGGDYYAFLNDVGYAEAKYYTQTLKSI